MHVCDRARRDCRRNPACTAYGDANSTVTNMRINMLARHNDSDYCGVYINDVSLSGRSQSIRLPIQRDQLLSCEV